MNVAHTECWRQAWYGIALFLSAAGALVIEIVAGRLLAPYIGMSLYSWTAIIAVVLAGLSAGHWIGGRLAGPAIDGARGSRRVAAALLLASAASAAALGLLRVIAGPLLSGGTPPILAIVTLSTALFLLPSLFVGIVSPILTKLALDAAPGQPGRVLGRMYALGAVGSIAGTLAAGYLFISWIGSTGTVLSVAGLYAALGLAFCGTARAAVMKAGMTVVVGAGLGAWLASHQALTSPCLAESDYYCIRIDDFSRQSGRPSAVMVIDHLGHSISDRDDPDLLYTPYIHFIDELARRRFAGRAPPDALIIGGGGYTLPRAWARRAPDARLVVAEIDPTVTRVARERMWLVDGAGLRIVHRDGRAFLQDLPSRPQFDVVFLDAFHDISVPSHLVTREFHAAVRARLRARGFYALNVVDGGAAPRFLFSMVRTLQTVFPSVTVWREADDVPGARSTFAIVASDTSPAGPGLAAVYGIERLWRAWDARDLARRMAAAHVPILTDDFAPVDRLLSHILLNREAFGN